MMKSNPVLVGALVTIGDGSVRAKIVAINKTAAEPLATVELLKTWCDTNKPEAPPLPEGYRETVPLNLLHYLH